ncbi:proton-conducting transporter membrane subunit [Pseudarthrobacter sp. AL07]|uniref:proton-conducting transporter transmembrane domain-containing protein n=1 Tax=unclassified Pseudarthrobacter TaxID=2647000 RepID=UPI00249B41E8|nr:MULTISPECIES: proton-conducting transporter membrane subunit [unclassified Pseudarthrobacter]MDI3195243.1 proton-conducting transporter membrane subunit [Pseudarthrobacter sp. AL20]MDI3209309.1 proton-conducting transporter membrane subunit [Pseudarthrobacter sp. AL07]
MSALLLWLIVLPAVAGTVLATAGRRADRAAPAVAVVVAVLALALAGLTAAAAAAAAGPALQAPFMAGSAFGVEADALSAVLLPAVAGVTLLVLLFASAAGTTNPARFHGLMLIFTAAVLITLTATTLPTLLFAWEIMGAASYALIGFHWSEEHRMSSGLTAFLTTRTADLGLYIAAGAALAGAAQTGSGAAGSGAAGSGTAGSGAAAGTGSLALAGLAGLPEPWRDIAAAGLLAAGLGKAAQLPFSFWLSRAMDGPSAVSALLHSAAMVAMGGYLLLRVEPLLAATGWAAAAAAWAGAATAVVLGVVAVAQTDLKQLLAASTAAQLGYVVMAAGVGNVAGGAAHLMAHAATKSGLFLAAGAWLAALGTKKLAGLRGAGRRWPVLGAAFTVGALSLAGIAPLSLWATKDNVLTAALEHSVPLYVAGLAGAVLAAAYAAKAVALVWKPVLPETFSLYDAEEPGSRRITSGQTVPVLILAAGAAVAGLLVFGPGGNALRDTLGRRAPGDGVESGPLELAVSAALALAVVVLVWRFTARLPVLGAATGWLGMEAAAHAVVVRPVLAAAQHLARFDDAVLDRGVERAAVLALRAAGGAAAADAVLDRGVEASATATSRAAGSSAVVDTRIDDGVETLALAVRRAGSAAPRPQTGQVHHYYVQAALVLVAAAVLLILVR